MEMEMEISGLGSRAFRRSLVVQLASRPFTRIAQGMRT